MYKIKKHLFWFQGQSYKKCCSIPQFTFDFYRTLVHFHYFIHIIQAQTIAFYIMRFGVRSGKWFKNELMICFIDTYTVVLNAYFNGVADIAGANIDDKIAFAILDGIIDQVGETV